VGGPPGCTRSDMMLSYGPAMAAGGAGCLAIAWALFRRAPVSSVLPAKPGVEDFDRTGRPTLGPFATWKDWRARTKCFLKVLLEYPRLIAVYKDHKANGWFEYGSPPEAFGSLHEHPAVKKLLALRGSHGTRSTLEFESDFPVLPTYLPIEEGAAAALGAVGIAAAELFEERTGRAQRVIISQSGAGLTTAQYLFIYAQPSGQWKGLHGFDGTMAAEGSVKPQRKAYECQDGRWIFLHGGFPRLKKGLTDFLQCECTVKDMSAACAKWPAAELETAMQANGLAATMCQTPAEWRASAQGQAVLPLEAVVVEPRSVPESKAGFEDPFQRARVLPAKAARPLSDVLVLDFSHVIASPVVGRTLADHGATVIKIVSHARPRREMFDVETNHGKRTLAVELDTEEGKQRLWELLRVADVLIDGFTTNSLGKHGFHRDEVLRINPHLVYLDLSCFGHVGPLAHGHGFQQNANFAAGVAGIEDEELLGYQLVSQIDYATGYLGAYGAILGLLERERAAKASRQIEGVLVRTSLCQAATWMAEFGARAPGPFEWLCRVTRLLWLSDRRSTTVGDLTYLPPSTAVRMSITPPLRHGFERWWPDNAPTDDLVVAAKK